MTLKELRQQRSQKATRGKAAITEYNALAAKDSRTEAEDAQMTALNAEIEGLETSVSELDAQIEQAEAQARRGALFSTAPSGAAPSGRQAYGSAARTANEADPETTLGFRTLADFANSVRNASVGGGLMDPRLNAALPSNYNANGGAAGEGFLVPPEYASQIWELVFGSGDLLQAVNPEPTNSNVVQITKDETTPWGATGVQAYWRAEGAQLTASKLAQNAAQVPLHELYAFVVATDELLADAPRLSDRLTRKAAEAIRFKASDAIMWGDGVGKPLGFMNAACKVAVAKESGQAADTIVAANVAKQFSRLLPGNLGNAFWLANSDTLPQLMVMTIGNQPIWTPPNAGFANAPGGFLLGRPITFSEHADTVGDEGDLVLVDPSGYYAATKAGGGIDFAASIHLFFDYNATAFRWVFRLGGQPLLSAAITPKRSSNTKSHFVTIEARA